MTYLTVEEIMSVSDSVLAQYVRDITADSNRRNYLDLQNYLTRIRRNRHYINNDFVLSCLKLFLLTNYASLYYCFYEHQFSSDENLIIINYSVTNNSPISVIAPKSFKESFEQDAVLLEAGEPLSSVTDLKASVLMDELNTFTEEDQTKITDYLLALGINYFDERTTIIPTNSESLLQDETTSRFSSAVWYEEIQNKVIVLAGVGGIGSYVTFLLSRMKPKSLFIYDDDIVEYANMSGQLYCNTDVSKLKVDAIASMVSGYSMYNSVFAIGEKFTEDCEAADIMICGFDNMEARKTFFDKWVTHVNNKNEEDRKHCLFIDGRLAAEELQVFCIQGNDSYNIEHYKEFLFSDEEADTTICSYKQTTFMANMISSIIVNLFTNFVANEVMEGFRDLPFLTSYEAGSMMFKTEN